MRALPAPPPTTTPGHARGPAVFSRALITDLDGRWLTVLPAHPHAYWYLPGGAALLGESPQDCCDREVNEELGLPLHAHSMITVVFTDGHHSRDPGRLDFLFDYGTHDAATFTRNLTLPDLEIADHRWATPGEALTLLHPAQTQLLLAGRATTGHPAVYFQRTATGQPRPSRAHTTHPKGHRP